jgi:hypothetical protein
MNIFFKHFFFFSANSFGYWKLSVERAAQFQTQGLDSVSLLQHFKYMQYIQYMLRLLLTC